MPKSNEVDLRLRDLKVLSVVLRERSLTRTAEALDMTQPSVSKVLARLRAHFGDPLFIRNGPAMDPTHKTLEIAEPLRGLLIAASKLSASTPPFDPLTSERVFKLLVTDVGMARFLPPLVNKIAKEGNKLSLRAIPLDSRHFESKLESGEADLALGAFPKAPRGLRRQRLYFGSYLSVARRDHPMLRELRHRSGFSTARHVIVTASDTGHAAHLSVQHALESEIGAENIQLRLLQRRTFILEPRLGA